MMVVIFLLPGAEEMCLLFAHDGFHFYAAKSRRNVYLFSAQDGCHFMLPRAEEMYLLFALDGCHFYATICFKYL